MLVNSNPATIMTDPEFATATYVEPLLPGPGHAGDRAERPDALLPTLGGQTALNIAKACTRTARSSELGVELIGANYDAIDRAEDREHVPRRRWRRPACACPRSAIAHTLAEARGRAATTSGCRAIVRPAFTLGGRGGGIARTPEEFVADRRAAASTRRRSARC